MTMPLRSSSRRPPSERLPLAVKAVQCLALLALLAVVLCPTALRAYSLLTRTPNVSISVPDASIAVSTRSITPSQKLTYVVFVDTLTQSHAISFTKHLAGLITAKALPTSTTVVLVSKGSLASKPVNDAAAIVSTLLQTIDTSSKGTQNALEFYRLLLNALELATAPWESYVIIADPPQPSAGHSSDIAAYLSYACFTKKIRLSYCPAPGPNRILSRS